MSQRHRQSPILDSKAPSQPKQIDLTKMRANLESPQEFPSTPPGMDQALQEAEARVEDGLQGHFLPFTKLFDTPIVIQCGDGLKDRYTIHLELLSLFSEKMRQLFARAGSQYQKLEEATKLRRKIKALVPPQLPADEFQVDDATQACQLITVILKRYPLTEYQANLRTDLTAKTEELFGMKEHMKMPQSNGGIKKKEYQNQDVCSRLSHLSTSGAQVLTGYVFELLWKIKRKESEKAVTDPIKAAAQRRIILSKYSANTVNSVVHWMCRPELHHNNARQLCDIYALAEELGIDSLAKICLTQLASAALSHIEVARSEGVSLLFLLDDRFGSLDSVSSKGGSTTAYAQGPLADAVPTVFLYALKTKNPPAILENLVINAITESKEVALYDYVQGIMSDQILRKLARALVHKLAEPNEGLTAMDIHPDEEVVGPQLGAGHGG